MSRKAVKRRAGCCMRCAYFGVEAPATTNLSDNPMYGKLYCQECADYLVENFPPAYVGAERRLSKRLTHHDKEAT